jgi:hypothetical protein
MKIVAVTAYVPIPGHPRTPEQYRDLLVRLLETDIPLVCLEGELEGCWLYRYLRERGKTFTHSVAENPAKNSVAYHCVQAQKSEWLTTVAHLAEVLVWLDVGIFHLRGVTGRIIRDFMKRAAGERAVTLPGSWERDYEYRDEWPCWRFAGGVWVVPRAHVVALDTAMKQDYKRHLRETNNVSWEVNTLARMEQRGMGPPLFWYRANHDASLFTNYRKLEYADIR